MRSLITYLSALTIVLTATLSTQKALAYESDTHLRITYLLARSVGINDETAKYIAYSDLNIDKTLITSAMFHPAQRGLFHFTGTYQKLESNAHGGSGVVESIKELLWTRKIAIAERNHAVGSLLIYMGMQKGDLQLIGAGLHVKQDTYGHAGFTNAWGHMFDGHNPDRAFLETEKYEDMIRSLVQSLTAIRETLREEQIDKEGALKYLNQFASESAVKRNLTEADLSDATKISTVLLSSTELKRMYSESIFNNYQFKKLALKLIFDDFKAREIISKDLTFNELFPEELLRDTRMDTADTIKAVIVSDMESDLLKNKNGKDIIKTEKLFGVEKSEQLMSKTQLEMSRYEARLRSFEIRRKKFAQQGSLSNLDYQIEKESLDKEYVELSVGMHLDNINGELADAMANASEETKQLIAKKESEIRAKYETELNTVEDLIQSNALKNLPLEDRYEALLKGGELAEKVMNEIAEMKREILFEVFVQIRSRQLAEFKLATEIADRLTKDFIPRKYTQYIKQAFETETYTRVFETYFKDEAWRRYLSKHFGVNWVFGDGANKHSLFQQMKIKFKKAVMRKSAYNDAVAKRTQRLLKREAVKLAEERIPGDLGTRDEAQELKYTKRSAREWTIKMIKFVTPAITPFIGETYLKGLYDLAEKEAKKHETEDMKAAVESGKYQSTKDKTILDQINRFAAPNKCVHLFLM